MKRFAVIGLGRFGRRLAVMLARAGAEVIAVDRDRDVIEDIRDSVTLAICMDGTDENALRTQGLDKVDVAVVGLGTDFENAMLTTVILKQLGVPLVVSRATTVVRADILKRIGADALVNPEEEAAYRWAHRLLGPSVIEQIELAEGHSLVQVPVPEEWVGKSLAELDVRRRYGVNVVAIRHPASPAAEAEALRGSEKEKEKSAKSVAAPTDRGGEVIEVPLPHSKLSAGDIVVLIGADEAISSLPG